MTDVEGDVIKSSMQTGVYEAFNRLRKHYADTTGKKALYSNPDFIKWLNEILPEYNGKLVFVHEDNTATLAYRIVFDSTSDEMCFVLSW